MVFSGKFHSSHQQINMSCHQKIADIKKFSLNVLESLYVGLYVCKVSKLKEQYFQSSGGR